MKVPTDPPTIPRAYGVVLVFAALIYLAGCLLQRANPTNVPCILEGSGQLRDC